MAGDALSLVSLCHCKLSCSSDCKGSHRIRHYGLIAGAVRAHNIERLRQLLTAATQPRESERAEADNETETPPTARRCPCCGGRMIIIDTFEGARPAQSPSPTRIRIDTS